MVEQVQNNIYYVHLEQGGKQSYWSKAILNSAREVFLNAWVGYFIPLWEWFFQALVQYLVHGSFL